jgi:hypothetical protein
MIYLQEENKHEARWQESDRRIMLELQSLKFSDPSIFIISPFLLSLSLSLFPLKCVLNCNKAENLHAD